MVDGLLLSLASTLGYSSTHMVCGEGVALCGVLTLESGLGRGVYHHRNASVHGLWPQVPPYGSSQCLGPSRSRSRPSVLYPCYSSVHTQTQLSFETHEWTKHGECAGVTDASDYFSQICTLAAAPTAVIERVRLGGGDLEGMAEALRAFGYPIWNIDPEHLQLELSACSDVKTRNETVAESDKRAVGTVEEGGGSRGGGSGGGSGTWRLAPPAQFGCVCGARGGAGKR